MNRSGGFAKRILVFLILVSVPALVFLNLWQVFNYDALQAQVNDLEKEQRDWLELNKRMVANLAIYSSPARLDKLAPEELDLIKNNGEKNIRILLTHKKE